MKKILTFLVLAAMLLSALSLTSCQILKIQIEPGDDLKEIINGLFNKETPEEIRYTITQEEWNANIHIRNYTMVAGRNTNYYKQTEQAIEVDGQLFVRKNGVDYLLQKDGFNWYGTPSDEFPVTYTLYERFEMEFKFSDLVYNEDYHSYDLEIYEDEILSFSFENGVLVSISMIFDYEDLKIQIKDIGKTVIEVPEFTIVESTEDQ